MLRRLWYRMTGLDRIERLEAALAELWRDNARLRIEWGRSTAALRKLNIGLDDLAVRVDELAEALDQKRYW